MQEGEPASGREGPEQCRDPRPFRTAKRVRKGPGESNATNGATAPAPRCQRFLKHKNRCCQALRAPGTDLCPIHLAEKRQAEALVRSATAADQPDSSRADGEADDDRIPCPINPAHTVRASALSGHLHVCPDRLRDPSLSPYFESNVNLPRGVAASSAPQTGSAVAHFRDLDAAALAAFVEWLTAAHARASSLVAASAAAAAAAGSFVAGVPVDHRAMPGLEEYVLHGSRKHAAQQSSLLAKLFLSGTGPCDADCPLWWQHPAVSFVELGAGKGGVSSALRVLCPTNPLTVVDRHCFRDMKDREIRHRSGAAPVARVAMDVKDFSLRRLLDGGVAVDATAATTARTATSGQPSCCFLGKHLCGGCTDLALACAVTDAGKHCLGITIATCCHQLCTWDTYFGRATAFEERSPHLPFESASQFQITSSITSWGISGKEVGPERARIGRMAKELIDFGRVLALREMKIFRDVRLVEFCEGTFTVENRAIVAVR